MPSGSGASNLGNDDLAIYRCPLMFWTRIDGQHSCDGGPLRAITTSSPRSTRARSRDKWVFASCTLTTWFSRNYRLSLLAKTNEWRPGRDACDRRRDRRLRHPRRGARAGDSRRKAFTTKGTKDGLAHIIQVHFGPHSRHPPRRLRSHCADRRRRHGRGVSRARHEAESRRRDQGPARRRSRAIPNGSRGSRAKRRRSPR